MTATDSVVRARIDSETKAKATKALHAQGLTMSDAIRLFLSHVANQKKMPFPIKVPNAEMGVALEELEKGGRRQFNSLDEIFKDAGI